MRRKLAPKSCALPGATLSQEPELRRASSASSCSMRSSSVISWVCLRARERSRPFALFVSALMPWPPLRAGIRRSRGRSRRLEELIVRADAHHAAVVEHDDAVGVGDGRDALRHDDLGDLWQLPPQRLPQPRIGGEVERRERVVEHEDVGVVHDRPGDGEPLALAARHVGAALCDAAVQPAFHVGHEVAALGDLERVPELGVGGLLATESQVGGHGAGEEEGTLRHEADRLPQLVEVGLAHVDAVDPDGAARRVEQPRDERDERRLAGAGRADDRDGLAGLGPEGDAVQHRVTPRRGRRTPHRGTRPIRPRGTPRRGSRPARAWTRSRAPR